MPSSLSITVRSIPSASLLLVSILILLHAGARAQEWTRFRGPGGAGIGEARGLPASWSEEDYIWRTRLPGVGHSQPVIWGDRIFLTSAPEDGSSRSIVCLRAGDGNILWQRSYASKDYRTNERNSHAASTPAVDAASVYFVAGHPEELTMRALDHGGKDLWSFSLGPYASQHGFGASPMLFEDLVVFGCEQGLGGESFLIAIERQSGKVRWRTQRRTVGAAYCTPCVLEIEGKPPQLLFTSQAHGISGVDARTGVPLWEARVFDKRCVSSPVLADGLVFGSCGSGGGGNYVAAVRVGGEGDVTATHLAYTVKQSAPYVPSVLAKDGLAYLWSDRGGIVTCIRAKTGEVIWRERVGGNYYGSPVWADGKIYCIAESGEVVAIAGGDEFRLLGRSSLGEPSRSTPAVAGGRLYLRSIRHLAALGPREEEPSRR
ncbi:MAG: PQQ-like beta-propeller repeat protein [Planctomycetes bacterium]|nr:PQQ-like beta-propeller repeat protein [Planctomycetota bacterium]